MFYGIWASIREEYLQEAQPERYQKMKMKNELIPYLQAIQEEYYQKFSKMVENMMARENVTEELKMKDQMAWVGQVNNIRARAQEILTEELCH